MSLARRDKDQFSLEFLGRVCVIHILISPQIELEGRGCFEMSRHRTTTGAYTFQLKVIDDKSACMLTNRPWVGCGLRYDKSIQAASFCCWPVSGSFLAMVDGSSSAPPPRRSEGTSLKMPRRDSREATLVDDQAIWVYRGCIRQCGIGAAREGVDRRCCSSHARPYRDRDRCVSLDRSHLWVLLVP